MGQTDLVGALLDSRYALAAWEICQELLQSKHIGSLVTVLALGRETSTESEEKEKEQSCCTSIFSLPFCISIKCGLLRVEGALPQSCLLMLFMILKFMILLGVLGVLVLGVIPLAYYRSFSHVKPKEQANSNRLKEANCGDLVDWQKLLGKFQKMDDKLMYKIP